MKNSILEAMQFAHIFDKDPINTTGAAPATITYQFARNTKPGDLPSNSTFTGWTAFAKAEKIAIKQQLKYLETILNVDFVQVTGDSDPDLNLGKVDTPSGTAGFGGNSISFFGTDITRWDGFAVFDNTLNLANASQVNLILHELAHALGLKHPFEGTATLPAAQESNKYTVMSYTANPDTGLDADELMLYDVAALQDIWGGADKNTGNTTYNAPTDGTVDLIWDTGGVDTLTAAGLTTDVTIDLRPEKFSAFGGFDDVVIASQTWIENATGGAGNDTITGNRLDNRIDGKSGNDTVLAGAGKDSIYGGLGNDTLHGQKGNDRIWGHAGGDDLFGNNGRDILRGGKGRDEIDGGKGDDVCYGGGGRDTFVFAAGGGNDVIMDFKDDFDMLKFVGLGTAATVLSNAADVGSDVVFSFIGGHTLTVLNTTVAEVTDDILV